MDWGVVLDILVKVGTLVGVSILTTLGGIILSKVISKFNNSRIYKYAKTLVEAAEQKFPNEGTKMGPQKQDYVMGQLAIKFPSIRDNQYLYNIVLQCVYELNQEIQTQKLQEEFDKKFPENETENTENGTVETANTTNDSNSTSTIIATS